MATLTGIFTDQIQQLEGIIAKLQVTGPPESGLISSSETLSAIIDAVSGLPNNPPSLFVDLEGNNLSRHGSVSILQLFVPPIERTYLIDVLDLGHSAFSTRGANGQSLRDILESSVIQKVFFDVRTDSDALYGHFKINLAGVQDLQLMEFATRSFPKSCVNGLAKCIEQDAGLSWTERTAWSASKAAGRKLFAPELGGDYAVFDERPLSEEIQKYCMQDVQFLPCLWNRYNGKITSQWENRVKIETVARIQLSQSATFSRKGRNMAMAPKGWNYYDRDYRC